MVKIEFEGKTKVVKATTVKGAMTLVGILPEEYLSILNGEVVTEHEAVSNRDTVKFVKVWSGG